MKRWVTKIKAIDPADGLLKTWAGLTIIANTSEEAQEKCNEAGKGYMQVYGEFIEEID